MMTRAEKETVIEQIKENLDKSRAVFLTNLIGISSNDAVSIRKNIREAKGNVIVTRNTLFARASQGTPFESMLSGLKGPSAVAFAYEDAPAVAKVLYDAGKELELVSIQKGFLGDKELSKNDVEALAKLPSREQMLGTLLATFNAPVSAFARVLNAISEKKEEGGEAPAPAEAEA